jgi:acyl-CoA thioesterase-1
MSRRPTRPQVATLVLILLIPLVLAAASCRRAGHDGDGAVAAAPVPAVPARPAPGSPAPGSAAPRPSAVPSLTPSSSPAASGGTSPAPTTGTAAAPLVVFLGDSLTAGLGLPADQAYPSLLARDLSADGFAVRVNNAGVSGDTTAGGLRRLRWLLAQHPAVVVVGLGGNDALRGQPVAETERNLRQIVAQARQAGAQVLLLGMRIPPNYGPDYTAAFADIYPRIALDLHVPLVPFLLAGVGGVADLNQADGIHPTAEGQVKVAANVKPYLEKLLPRQRLRDHPQGVSPGRPAHGEPRLRSWRRGGPSALTPPAARAAAWPPPRGHPSRRASRRLAGGRVRPGLARRARSVA